jgi:hypothetical protein
MSRKPKLKSKKKSAKRNKDVPPAMPVYGEVDPWTSPADPYGPLWDKYKITLT